MKIKHTNTPEESERIVNLLLNGNNPLKSENTDSKEKSKEILNILYYDKPSKSLEETEEIMELNYNYSGLSKNSLEDINDRVKKEENNMENYIMINGIKIELTEEQLKQLGIEVEKKRNNPFNSELKFDEKYYHINTINGVFSASFKDEVDEDFIVAANSFNDCEFAYQVYLHELLNRKLLKYAWDNNAEDCEWDEYGVNSHYYIYFDSAKGHFNVQANQYFHHQNIYFSSEKVAKQAIKDIIEPFMKEHPEFVW